MRSSRSTFTDGKCFLLAVSMWQQEIIGQQPEPVSKSSERDVLMAQVEESTAGLCKGIPHLTVQTHKQLAYSDKEGPQQGRKVSEAWGVSLSGWELPPLRQTHDPTRFVHLWSWGKLYWQLWFQYVPQRSNTKNLFFVFLFPQTFIHTTRPNPLHPKSAVN